MPEQPRYYPVPSDVELVPGPRQQDDIPLWVGSWGSSAGLARVARAGDGWLASAYNTTPERFSDARSALERALADHGRESDGFPNALATMWTWVSKDQAEADHVLAGVPAPVLRRDPDELRPQVCVGPAEHCAELLSRYAEAGCERVYLWPLGDERYECHDGRAPFEQREWDLRISTERSCRSPYETHSDAALRSLTGRPYGRDGC
jgi:alkanesulfonate monooxygenase SsuD/methylene tetrahydromethanopterin reductase-like flavin-dependent oxidoreductase (luciferase family)